MDWREDYKRKLGSPEDAAARVKSGDLVHTGLLPMPRLIADAIVARREELGHLDVTMVEPEYDPGFLDNAFSDKFSVTVEIHIGSVAIDAMDEKRVDYSPVLFSTWFKPVTDPRPNFRTPDVFLCTVSPPDDNGYCSFGADLWNKHTLAKHLRHSPGRSGRTVHPHLRGQPYSRFGDRRLRGEHTSRRCTTRNWKASSRLLRRRTDGKR